MKVKLLAAILIACVLVTHMESVAGGPEDCIDACYTGCVNSNGNTRLMQRCEAKCRVRCGRNRATEQVVRP